jgi:cell division transport system permease protein
MNKLFQSIKRTPYQSLASFFILFFTLFLALFFFNLTAFFYGILSYVEAKPQVTVYFQTQIPENDIFKARDAIIKSAKASAVKYISKKEALKIYQELNKNNPLLLEMVSADILPASLEINAKKLEYLSEIAEFLKKNPGVDEVVFQKNIVDRLLIVTNILRKTSAFIFIFLMFVSFMVLMTTTAFKIALKKDEIELQRLLGASIFYVRKPFLAEGLFFGFLGGTFAWFVLSIIFYYLQPFLNSYLYGVPQLSFYQLSQYNLYIWPPSLQYFGFIYLLTVFFGMLIGFIGNYLSTSKYIK